VKEEHKSAWDKRKKLDRKKLSCTLALKV